MTAAQPFMPLQNPSRQPGPPAYFQYPQQQQFFSPPAMFQPTRPQFASYPQPGQQFAPGYPPFQTPLPPTQGPAGVQPPVRPKRKKKKTPTQLPVSLPLQHNSMMQQAQQQFIQQPPMPLGLPASIATAVSPPAVSVTAGLVGHTTSSDVLVVESVVQGKGKKSLKCWKCAVDSHNTKDCTVQHFCIVCDNFEHPTARCPIVKLPKPYASVAGSGSQDTILLQLPDSVFKAHLAPKSSPFAKITVIGESVPAAVIQSQMARICPLNSQWKWEAIPHGTDSFLIGFPSFEDLQRVEGIQLGVPRYKAQIVVSVWEIEDIQHKFELSQVWVHVEGVPYTVRHFHGLWAVGTLIGKTLDVDLFTLRSRGIVRILVALVDPLVLSKSVDAHGPYLRVTATVLTKGYEFTFRREKEDFVPDLGFTPFFWRRKNDDRDDGFGKDKGTDGNGDFAPDSVGMEVDPSGPSGSTALPGPSSSQVAPRQFAVTPLNPSPTTVAGRELVEAARLSSGVGPLLLPSVRRALDVALGRSSSSNASPVSVDGGAASRPMSGVRAGMLPVDAGLGPESPRHASVGSLVVAGAGGPSPVGPLSLAGPGAGAGSGEGTVQVGREGVLSELGSTSAQPTRMTSPAVELGSTLASPTQLASPVAHVASEPFAASVCTPAISPVLTTPRRSGRFAEAADGSSLTDEDTLSKAMRRKAVQNLDSTGTSSCSKHVSFLSFSQPRISSQLHSVGISLGSNVDSISVSTKALRHMEYDRLKVIPNVLAQLDYSPLDDEEVNDTSDGQLLNHLVGDVSEVGMDDDGFSSIYELKAAARKSKSNSRRKSVNSRSSSRNNKNK
jgi:hypothetical protein